MAKIPQNIFEMPELALEVEGGAGRSHNWSRRAFMMSPWILEHCVAKRVMPHILVEFLICHHLNHVLNIGSKSTRSERVGGVVQNLINDVLKHIKSHMLHESIQ
jgi:hypothetical protein